jgi:hypothetical protein
MQKKETERKRKRKALLGEKKEVCSKKSLTGPTLLEMFGYHRRGVYLNIVTKFCCMRSDFRVHNGGGFSG